MELKSYVRGDVDVAYPLARIMLFDQTALFRLMDMLHQLYIIYLSIYLYIYIYMWVCVWGVWVCVELRSRLVQSAGAAQITDCISAEE